jgi:hypothetical protein
MMRRFVTFFPVPALLPASLSAQGLSVSGAATPLHDTRPFGTYLVQVCTLSYGGPLDCPAPFPEKTKWSWPFRTPRLSANLSFGKVPHDAF